MSWSAAPHRERASLSSHIGSCQALDDVVSAVYKSHVAPPSYLDGSNHSLYGIRASSLGRSPSLGSLYDDCLSPFQHSEPSSPLTPNVSPRELSPPPRKSSTTSRRRRRSSSASSFTPRATTKPKAKKASPARDRKKRSTATPKSSSAAANSRMFHCTGYGGCEMTFTRSEHLARHVRKHTGERPFGCHCGRSFSRLDNLRQHASTVHADAVDQNATMLADLSRLHTSLSANATLAQWEKGMVRKDGAKPTKASKPSPPKVYASSPDAAYGAEEYDYGSPYTTTPAPAMAYATPSPYDTHATDFPSPPPFSERRRSSKSSPIAIHLSPNRYYDAPLTYGTPPPSSSPIMTAGLPSPLRLSLPPISRLLPSPFAKSQTSGSPEDTAAYYYSATPPSAASPSASDTLPHYRQRSAGGAFFTAGAIPSSSPTSVCFPNGPGGAQGDFGAHARGFSNQSADSYPRQIAYAYAYGMRTPSDSSADYDSYLNSPTKSIFAMPLTASVSAVDDCFPSSPPRQHLYQAGARESSERTELIDDFVHPKPPATVVIEPPSTPAASHSPIAGEWYGSPQPSHLSTSLLTPRSMSQPPMSIHRHTDMSIAMALQRSFGGVEQYLAGGRPAKRAREDDRTDSAKRLAVAA